MKGLSYSEFLRIPLDDRQILYNFKLAYDLQELLHEIKELNPSDYKDSKLKARIREKRNKLKQSILTLKEYFDAESN